MIVLTSKYPSQSAADGVNYALAGKARNVSASGDGTGTPLEKDWMNDLFGWQQALMAAAGLTPNGTVETQNASQLLQAMLQIRSIGAYSITSSVAKNATQKFGLNPVYQLGGYSLASDVVTVPAAGKYRLALSGVIYSTDTANPKLLLVSIEGTSSRAVQIQGQRYSASTGDAFSVSGETIFDITTPSSQGISVQSNAASMLFNGPPNGFLIVERVG